MLSWLGSWCHKDGKKREARELGIQWILEKEKKLWEDKEERPKSSRAMFGHAFVIGFFPLCYLRFCQHLPQIALIMEKLVRCGNRNDSGRASLKKEVGDRRWWKSALVLHNMVQTEMLTKQGSHCPAMHFITHRCEEDGWKQTSWQEKKKAFLVQMWIKENSKFHILYFFPFLSSQYVIFMGETVHVCLVAIFSADNFSNQTVRVLHNHVDWKDYLYSNKVCLVLVLI